MENGDFQEAIALVECGNDADMDWGFSGHDGMWLVLRYVLMLSCQDFNGLVQGVWDI